MKGDIAIAGFYLTAEEWQALDTAARAQLVEAATRRLEAMNIVSPVLAVGPLLIAVRDRGLEPAEVRLDGRRVAEVLRALALRPGDPLFL